MISESGGIMAAGDDSSTIWRQETSIPAKPFATIPAVRHSEVFQHSDEEWDNIVYTLKLDQIFLLYPLVDVACVIRHVVGIGSWPLEAFRAMPGSLPKTTFSVEIRGDPVLLTVHGNHRAQSVHAMVNREAVAMGVQQETPAASAIESHVFACQFVVTSWPQSQPDAGQSTGGPRLNACDQAALGLACFAPVGDEVSSVPPIPLASHINIARQYAAKPLWSAADVEELGRMFAGTRQAQARDSTMSGGLPNPYADEATPSKLDYDLARPPPHPPGTTFSLSLWWWW